MTCHYQELTRLRLRTDPFTFTNNSLTPTVWLLAYRQTAAAIDAAGRIMNPLYGAASERIDTTKTPCRRAATIDWRKK